MLFGGTEETCNLLTEYENLYGECVVDIHKSPVLKSQLLRVGRLVCFRDVNHNGARMGFVVKSDSANNAIVLLTFDHGKDYEEAIEKYKLPYVPIRDYITKNFPKIKFSGRLRVVLVPYENVCFIGRYSLKTSINSIINNEKSAVQEASEQIQILTKYQNSFEELAFKFTRQLSLHDLTVEKINY